MHLHLSSKGWQLRGKSFTKPNYMYYWLHHRNHIFTHSSKYPNCSLSQTEKEGKVKSGWIFKYSMRIIRTNTIIWLNSLLMELKNHLLKSSFQHKIIISLSNTAFIVLRESKECMGSAMLIFLLLMTIV